MTTTDLIKLLQKLEYGASGRPREISLIFRDKYISSPDIKLYSSGGGCAGAELTLLIESDKVYT